jgi:hypothetical protein
LKEEQVEAGGEVVVVVVVVAVVVVVIRLNSPDEISLLSPELRWAPNREWRFQRFNSEVILLEIQSKLGCAFSRNRRRQIC